MAELIINISGFGLYKLELSLHDAVPDSPIEVWSAVFTEVEHDDSYTIYFEVDNEGDPEVWDLVNLAIEAYKRDMADE